MPYKFLPKELQAVKSNASAARAAEKYIILRDGGRTSLLVDIEDRMRQIAPSAAPPGVTGAKFEVLLWDSYYMGQCYDLSDPEKGKALLARFDRLQASITMGGHVRPPELYRFLIETKTPMVAYMRTCQERFSKAVQSLGSPEAVVETIRGSGRKSWWINPLNGDTVEFAALATLIDLAEHVRDHPTLVGAMLDSEAPVEIRSGEVTTAVAAADGVEGPAEDDRRWCSENSAWVAHRVVARIAGKVWPWLTFTTDPQYPDQPRQYEGLNVISDWGTPHYAPLHPGNIAYKVEHAHSRNRASGRKALVQVGPQLGTVVDHRGTQFRPTPPQVYSMAVWLAIAFGSQRLMGWGFPCLFDKKGQFMPNGKELWELLPQLRDRIYRPLGDLLSRWRPAKRRTAMFQTQMKQSKESRLACKNIFAATMATGEPTDLIGEDHIRQGHLAQYEALIVPRFEAPLPEIVKAIEAFGRAGRTLIVPKNSPLRRAGLPKVRVLDRKYHGDLLADQLVPTYTRSSGLSAEEFTSFLTWLTYDIETRLPFLAEVGMNRYNVYANVMTDGADDYLVLVNGLRVPGQEAEWFFRTKRRHKVLDACKPNTVGVNWRDRTLVDVLSGKTFAPGASVPLAAGWGRVLKPK